MPFYYNENAAAFFREVMHYQRIKKQAEFQRLFNKGKRAFSSTVTVLYRPAEKTSMGISVGKRHGKSVQRNRIKRLLREAFRLNVDKIEGKYAFILIPKVREEYSFQAFWRDIQWIIQKEKL